MSRRVSKRGWIVLVSIPSDDGASCVDLFEWPGRGFGFQHFRSDPEDMGGWTPIGGASAEYASATEAAANAVVAVDWLTTHDRAKRTFEDWLASKPR